MNEAETLDVEDNERSIDANGESSVPLIVLDQNGLRREALDKERIDEQDILHAGRRLRGLAKMDQVRYAILEPTGDITIIPKHA